MTKKGIIPMLGKVGKVGRKRLENGEIKTPVRIYKKKNDIDFLGGEKKVVEDLSNVFEERLKFARESSPVSVND